jgi:fucose permease
LTSFHELVPVTIASAFVFGMVLSLLGSIKLPLAERLGLDEARVGGLLAALNLAFIPMMLASGILVDKLGVRGVIIGGAILTGTALVLLAFANTYRAALYSLLGIGAGAACLSTGSMVLMPRAFFENNAAASANLGNVFFGLGALATPALAEVLERGMGLRQTLSLLALVALTPALAAAVGPAEAYALSEGSSGDLVIIVLTPAVWMTGLVFFLYSPVEGALATWASTYLTQLGFGRRKAALLLCAFWLTFLGARLAASYFQQRELLPRNSEPWLIVFLGVGAGVMLANLAGTHSRNVAGTGLLLTGAFLGPIFPTLVGALFDNTSAARHGTAFGAMYAMGSTGSVVLAPIIGAFARRHSVRTALRLPAIAALALAGLALVLALMIEQG